MAGRFVRFSILGPLEVTDQSGRSIEIGGRQQRALLAILLLHANEVVPVARLIDDLWGDEPPEGAAKAVQISVSRLRKALGTSAALLETRGGGYVVALEEGQLDLRRFERLELEGRHALARGALVEGADLLDEALALWRGPPLAEFGQQAFRHEAARLTERRLAALEERADAQLALGRHASLVAELGRLVEEHPFRERPRGQLMLALARSGRQADALRIYDEGRRRLVGELGIEPGGYLRELQRAILRQEAPAIASPRPTEVAVEPSEAPAESREEAGPRPVSPAEAAPDRPARERRSRQDVATAAIVLSVVAAAAVVAIVVTRGGNGAVSGHVVAVLEAEHGTLAATIDVGERPAAVAAGLGRVWVASGRDATVLRINPASRTVERTIGLGFAPSGLAVGADALWVADAAEGRLVRIHAVTGVRERTFDVGRGGPGPIAVAFGAGSVWTANSNGFVVVRIDPRDNRVLAEIRVDAPRFIAAGSEGVWLVQATNAVLELDPVTNEPSARLPTGFGAGGLALGANSVWVSDPVEDTVWRFDARTRSLRRTIDVGAGPRALAFGFGSLWVANAADDTVSRVDSDTNEQIAKTKLGGRPAGVAVGGGAVWATVAPR